MSFLVGAGAARGGETGYANALERARSIAWSGSTDSDYPLSNLGKGRSNRPWKASAVGADQYLSIDLAQWTGGGFEEASLAAAGWTIGSGTPARSTAQHKAGVASALVHDGESISRDLVVPCGGHAYMTCWLIAPTSGTGKVYVQDMTRGGLYLTTSGTTWQAASAVYGSGFQTSWQQIAGTTLAGGLVPPKLITLPSAAECGGPGVTLRVTLTATGGDCYFDEVEIYPAINACYIGGHNLGPHINVAVDGAPGLSLVPQPGGFYDYAADNIPDRTLTITFYGTPANPISIGNLWLGEVRELEQGVNYGYRVRRVERQQVSPDGTVHVLSDGPERVLEDLTFGCGSLEQFRDLVDTLLDPMRMMAYPALIIPDSSMYGDGLALVGRLDAPDWAETRRGLEPREVVVTIVEDELPTETA